MQPILQNNYWMATNNRIGPWTVETEEPSDMQKHNAEQIYIYMRRLGWSKQSIAGIIGNMQRESTINPAYIEAVHRTELPQSGTELSDVPNSVMVNFFDPNDLGASRRAIGLVQWDGASTTTGVAQQKLVGFCMRYNLVWYEGESQCFRLKREWQTDNTYHYFKRNATYHGTHYSFQEYVRLTIEPEDCALIWQSHYEVSAGSEYRAENARWWYEYLKDIPVPLSIATLNSLLYNKKRILKRPKRGELNA